jgi:hypothetical protein
MALGDLTSPAAVESALDEFDQLERDAFLNEYGFGRARRYFVWRNGKYYDSKAIAGAAHGFHRKRSDGLIEPTRFCPRRLTPRKQPPGPFRLRSASRCQALPRRHRCCHRTRAGRTERAIASGLGWWCESDGVHGHGRRTDRRRSNDPSNPWTTTRNGSAPGSEVRGPDDREAVTHRRHATMSAPHRSFGAIRRPARSD